MVFTKNMTMLFIGDSVTDCGRDRGDDKSLGYSYVKYFADKQRQRRPSAALRILNKGISGDRVCDLKNRFFDDCLKYKPDFLSVLIGINDTWRAFDSNSPTSAECFYEDYRSIMESFRSVCPQSKLLILEQFLLPLPEDKQCWRGDLNEKIAMTRKIADEFADEFIPLDTILTNTAQSISSYELAEDGVHPTESGHRLISGKICDLFES